MTGNADYECYKKTLKVVSKVKTIDMIIAIFVSQGLITSDGPALAVVETHKASKKPILAYWMGGNSILNGVRILKRHGIPVYSSPARVAKAAASLITYSEYRNKVSA
jgi:acyl-CoA synthetase (NDP forming)